MLLRLVPLDRSHSPLDFDEFPLTIGRGEDVECQLSCRWISRRHCQIDRVGERLIVRDLGSRHGTYVNGQSVQEAVLRDGDEMTLGLHRLRVQWQGAASRMEHVSFMDLERESV